MNRRLIETLLACGLLLSGAYANPPKLKVFTTHPLLSDLTRQVGGEAVEVVDLLKPGSDIHHFEPSANDLRAIRGAGVLFASGKNLEPYLGKLADSLGPDIAIVEVGKPIPSIKISADDPLFFCCPSHAVGSIDPHWWHSAANMARAAGVVGKALAEADPSRSADYRSRAKATASRMKALQAWAQKKIAVIPRSERKLVTAHAAFSYFCKEYGFRMIPVTGLAREEDYSPKFVAEALKIIRDEKIRAIFPEEQANPKILEEIARHAGVALASPLIADGTAPGAGSTFEGMLRHNVDAVVRALAPARP